MHNWSKYEVVKFYERLLDKGIIGTNGAAYRRMLNIKENIERENKNRRLKYVRKMRQRLKATNGKA
tara:strand:- start:936 stop:1133 length:198 start_codon:yes stop_codon:yes gene_type:complete